jgi:hypothetical protein
MTKDILPIRVVCATRLPRNKFLTHTPLGKSIKWFIDTSNAEVKLFADNLTGLSEVYNIAIDESVNNSVIFVFVHDDILFCDFFWAQHIRDGLNKFDIIGLAGNLRRVPKQPSWAFINDNLTWDLSANLSGTVAHGSKFPEYEIKSYGPTGKECKILDGLLLAVKSETLINNKLRFDEIFKFHFYDIDFCRQAELKNLKMGTIPLSVVHQSGGNFSSAEWRNSYQTYLNKWND